MRGEARKGKQKEGEGRRRRRGTGGKGGKRGRGGGPGRQEKPQKRERGGSNEKGREGKPISLYILPPPDRPPLRQVLVFISIFIYTESIYDNNMLIVQTCV